MSLLYIFVIIVLVGLVFGGVVITVYSIQQLKENERYKAHLKLNPNLLVPRPELEQHEATAALILGGATIIVMVRLINLLFEVM